MTVDERDYVGRPATTARRELGRWASRSTRAGRQPRRQGAGHRRRRQPRRAGARRLTVTCPYYGEPRADRDADHAVADPQQQPARHRARPDARRGSPAASTARRPGASTGPSAGPSQQPSDRRRRRRGERHPAGGHGWSAAATSSASCSAAAAWPRSARAPTSGSAASSRSSGCAPTWPATRPSRPGSAARRRAPPSLNHPAIVVGLRHRRGAGDRRLGRRRSPTS